MLADCHGVAMLGPCSYGALTSGMDAIDASSDKPAAKAKDMDYYQVQPLRCLFKYGHQREYLIIQARAQLRAGLDYQKARDKDAAYKDLSDAVETAESSIVDDTIDAGARADARDILKQANEALNAL